MIFKDSAGKKSWGLTLLLLNHIPALIWLFWMSDTTYAAITKDVILVMLGYAWGNFAGREITRKINDGKLEREAVKLQRPQGG